MSKIKLNLTLPQLGALSAMNTLLYEQPGATCTALAEYVAIEQDHPEWLDDPDHWIWDLALSFGDPFK